MLRIVTTFFLLALALNLAKAQSDPHYSHFMYNQLSINPAYAGSKEALHIMGLYRNQWTGINGSPSTANINAHIPISNNRSGIGLSVIGDQIGIAKSLFVDASYAYRFRVSKKGTLALGIKGRLEYTRQDWTLSDPIDIDDSELPLAATGKTSPNFGVGLYYQDQRFYAGLSIPTLLRTSLYDDALLDGTNIRDLRSYYLIGGMMMRVYKGVMFRPSFMLSFIPNAPIDVNVNASFIFLDAVWAGLSYRLGDSVDLMLGYQFNKQLKASIAADITTSGLRRKSWGGIEVMVEYLMDLDCKCLNNIRYF